MGMDMPFQGLNRRLGATTPVGRCFESSSVMAFTNCGECGREPVTKGKPQSGPRRLNRAIQASNHL